MDRCGPCKQVAPIFEQLAAQHTTVRFAKVNADECQELCAEQGISALPTFQVYRNKKIVKTIRGANLEELQRSLESVASAPKTTEPDLRAKVKQLKLQLAELREEGRINSLSLQAMKEENERLSKRNDELEKRVKELEEQCTSQTT